LFIHRRIGIVNLLFASTRRQKHQHGQRNELPCCAKR
jgi:hypothetical protein